MTGLERVLAVFAGEKPDRVPFIPIVHAGLAPMLGVPLHDFFTSAEVMADTVVRGCRHFGYDGVQLSLGVTAEAEAFGAAVSRPHDASPVLTEYLLAERIDVSPLRGIDVPVAGSFPMFREAVERTVECVGAEVFVVVTLRGPMLMAAQLRGVQSLLMDILDRPAEIDSLLDFTAGVAVSTGKAFLDSGAHAVVMGEATCSSSFISPQTYRSLVLKHHRRVVSELFGAGWKAVNLHICGNLRPILEDVLSTGINFLDVDYQLSAADALAANAGRAVLRGNLDPSAVFAFGDENSIRSTVARLKEETMNRGHWIFSSGCDVSPGSPAANMELVTRLLGE
ncbi:MAG: uroporphyrinogen decarboxylase family protein [Planctomycetes bacterium]|nr:uroporphyrinogen decarboxylase family protein [Planctomycetota bacterium]